MPKYHVHIVYYADETVDVDAPTPEDALDAAWPKARASICCGCSERMNFEGEIARYHVYDADYNVVGGGEA